MCCSFSSSVCSVLFVQASSILTIAYGGNISIGQSPHSERVSEEEISIDGEDDADDESIERHDQRLFQEGEEGTLATSQHLLYLYLLFSFLCTTAAVISGDNDGGALMRQ